MACGTPVIASDRAALPEVVGTAAVLVDPTNEEAIAAAMLRVADDAGLRDSLRALGRARAAIFSPRASAARLAELYQRVLEGGHRS
jgi:glycosyltransferase involved in cell wall biosynthesis